MISMFILQNCHAATKAAEMAGRHMHHMRFFETTWWDILYIFIICAAVVLSIFIIISGYKKKLETLASKEEVDRKNQELSKKIAELEAIKNKLTDTKESPAFRDLALFREICSTSKNKEGFVELETANKLFELYQKIKEGNKKAENKSSSTPT